MTTVTRAADAPRAASIIISSSTRFSWTGGTSGWIRNTSRSRQLACSCTSRQSLANRRSRTGCRGVRRWAQISSASSGWALPPKTVMSRTGSSPSRLAGGQGSGGCGERELAGSGVAEGGLVGRQGQPVADGLLDELGFRPCVHGNDVLLAPEDVQHRVGLLVVVAQPHGERFLGVVLPGLQLSPAGVAAALDLRRAVDEVVVHAAAGTQPPAQ